MKKELKEKLFKDYPLTFGMYLDDPPINHYGLNIHNGWEPILRDLASKIEPILEGMDIEKRKLNCVVQIKEKFGGLRFYRNKNIINDILPLINEAEKKSMITCEYCGKAGKLHEMDKFRWVKTCCDKCYNKYKCNVRGDNEYE